jgi:hypothetical protein
MMDAHLRCACFFRASHLRWVLLPLLPLPWAFEALLASGVFWVLQLSPSPTLQHPRRHQNPLQLLVQTWREPQREVSWMQALRGKDNCNKCMQVGSIEILHQPFAFDLRFGLTSSAEKSSSSSGSTSDDMSAAWSLVARRRILLATKPVGRETYAFSSLSEDTSITSATFRRRLPLILKLTAQKKLGNKIQVRS